MIWLILLALALVFIIGFKNTAYLFIGGFVLFWIIVFLVGTRQLCFGGLC